MKEVKQKKERQIPFYDALEPVFESNPENLTPFVFINKRTGKPYSKNINRDIWNPACKRAGVNIKLNNACRHSWGNQMSMAGIDMETIRDGLGHSTTQTARNFYVNPSINRLKNVVNNVRSLS